ncbi:MAG: hypothetical protein ACOY46_20620 [Bacillota bacterium]
MNIISTISTTPKILMNTGLSAVKVHMEVHFRYLHFFALGTVFLGMNGFRRWRSFLGKKIVNFSPVRILSTTGVEMGRWWRSYGDIRVSSVYSSIPNFQVIFVVPHRLKTYRNFLCMFFGYTAPKPYPKEKISG